MRVTRKRKAATQKIKENPQKLPKIDDILTVEKKLTQDFEQQLEKIKIQSEQRCAVLKSIAQKLKEELLGDFKTKDVVVEKDDEYQVVLSVEEGKYKGKVYTMKLNQTQKVWVIGRSNSRKGKNSMTLSFPADAEISTTHGHIQFDQGKVYYSDLGSTNGSTVNGKVAAKGKKIQLETGNLIVIGATKLRVEIEK